jgi:4-aminobutyrate aminotransferase
MSRDDEVTTTYTTQHTPQYATEHTTESTTQHSPPPADAAFARRYARVFTPALAHYSPLIVERAEGAYLYARDGRRYLDLGSGIATTNVGHSHPRVVAAAEAQLRRVTHLSITAYHEAPLALAERLALVAPPGLDMVFFGNSGAEAVEGAVKLARRVTGRHAVISFLGGFHGRTFGALSATTSNASYRAGYAPLVPGYYLAPYPPTGGSAQACLAYLDRLFALAVAPGEVAAILVEPVQGEGGVVVPPASFLRGLRERCDRHGIVLIFDEIQTGFGRTGAMFAAQRFGVTPDVMAVAKALASGFPLSAIIGRRDLMDAWPEASHGTTFGGNLVSCAAALATLDVLQEERLPQRARRLGIWLLARLRRMAARHPTIAQVRGLGLMVGVECRAPEPPVSPAQVPADAGDVVHAVERYCLDAGVLALHCGPSGGVVRLLPPLTVGQADLEYAVDVLDRAFDSVERAGAGLREAA